MQEKAQGRLIVGYGACATGTVLINYFNLQSHIDFIVDDNISRQGRFSPGHAIPIKNSSSLSADSSVICLAWRHYKYYQHKLLHHNHFLPLPSSSIIYHD